VISYKYFDIRTHEGEMIIWDENRTGSDGGLQSTSKAKEHALRPNSVHEALPTLPLAPTLAPVFGPKEQAEADVSAVSDTGPVDAGMEIIRSSLEAIPMGSTLAFATDDLGPLLLAGAPLVRDPDFYRKVEDLAQACFCSLSVEEEAGTITFHRK
jgi:hypothetical protein